MQLNVEENSTKTETSINHGFMSRTYTVPSVTYIIYGFKIQLLIQWSYKANGELL